LERVDARNNVRGCGLGTIRLREDLADGYVPGNADFATRKNRLYSEADDLRDRLLLYFDMPVPRRYDAHEEVIACGVGDEEARPSRAGQIDPHSGDDPRILDPVRQHFARIDMRRIYPTDRDREAIQELAHEGLYSRRCARRAGSDDLHGASLFR
jgi:hypothetical protein